MKSLLIISITFIGLSPAISQVLVTRPVLISPNEYAYVVQSSDGDNVEAISLNGGGNALGGGYVVPINDVALTTLSRYMLDDDDDISLHYRRGL